MFRSPSGRVDALSTLGGGATTADCGAWNAAAFEAFTSGGGATTEFCRAGELRRCVRWAASGGGATTDVSICGASRVISAAGVNGTAGMASRGFSGLSDHATMLGRATSRFSLTLGGVTMVCERLSASRGSEMMGWREISGSACPGLRSLRFARIERRKIFRRLVIDHLRVVEGRLGNDLGCSAKKRVNPINKRECDDVIDARLNEAAPGQRALHEYIGPERRRGGLQFERRQAARNHQIAQIAEKDARPRRQLDQKPRNMRRLRDFVERRSCGHLTYSRCGNDVRIAGRTPIA